ncbi:sporulation protein [Marinactinospora rubrisoli]|uniref:Sporulation protein n=1 Tax=Marinactinospora rubrisoli TaxID=2715399 RepID=A0ABW2KH17_9ACTN
MNFKRVLAAFGVGGPSVDTVLANPDVRPGALLEGHVELSGGSVDVDVDAVVLTLVGRVEHEGGYGEEEEAAGVEFARITVRDAFRLAAEERTSLPFRFPLPWELPITDAGGGPLPGMVLGVRTDVIIGNAADKGDLDPLRVHPLPVQDRILEAFVQLGFTIKNADLHPGHLAATGQQMPVFQEIEFYPSPRYAHEVNEVEVSFVAAPHGVEVVLEFDKRGSMFHEGQDVYGRFRADHADADRPDWAPRLDAWIAEALEQHRRYFGHGGYGEYGQPGYQPEYGHPGYHPEYGHHHEEERGGMLSGAAGVALGVAGGLAAGYVAAEIVDEVFDGDEEEAESEEEEE